MGENEIDITEREGDQFILEAIITVEIIYINVYDVCYCRTYLALACLQSKEKDKSRGK